MRKLTVALIAMSLSLPPLLVPATASPPEFCLAANPGMPKCSFTVQGQTEVFGGAAGMGQWVVKVKRGKTVVTYTGDAYGAPTGSQFSLLKGDKVTATAKTAQSAVIVGFAY